VILATHDPEVVAAADRRVELQDGRLAHDGVSAQGGRAPFGIGLALFGDSGNAIISILGGGLRVVAASFAALASALLYYDLVVRSKAAPAAEPSAVTPGSGA
jgi:hypothetical protein